MLNRVYFSKYVPFFSIYSVSKFCHLAEFGMAYNKLPPVYQFESDLYKVGSQKLAT